MHSNFTEFSWDCSEESVFNGVDWSTHRWFEAWIRCFWKGVITSVHWKRVVFVCVSLLCSKTMPTHHALELSNCQGLTWLRKHACVVWPWRTRTNDWLLCGNFHKSSGCSICYIMALIPNTFTSADFREKTRRSWNLEVHLHWSLHQKR